MGFITDTAARPADWTTIRSCYSIDTAGRVVAVWRSHNRSGKVSHKRIYQGAADANDLEWKQTLEKIKIESAGGRAWIVAGLPLHASIVKPVEAPFASPSKAAKVFPSLLDVQLPFPVEDCAYRFLSTLKTADGQVESLAVAARHEDIQHRMDRLEELNIRPTVLDHEGLSLWEGACAECPDISGKNRIVCYLGHTRSALLVGVGNSLVSVHPIQSGAPENAEETASYTSRMFRVCRSLSVFNSRGELAWVWVGPQTDHADGLEAEIANNVNADIQFSTVKDPAGLLACAQATRLLKPGETSVNFLVDERTQPQLMSAIQTKGKRLAIGCLLAGVMLIASSAVWKVLVNQRIQEVQGSIDQLFEEITGGGNVQKGMEALLAERALDNIQLDAAAYLAPFSDPKSLILGQVLKISNVEDLRLRELNIGVVEFDLTATASSAEGFKELQKLFEAQGYRCQLNQVQQAADGLPTYTLSGKKAES